MILLFKLIAICSIWTLGLKIATAKGMILESWGNYGAIQVEKGKKVWEAIIVCHLCMPSLHSLMAYGFAVGLGIITGFEWRLVYMYPLVVMGTSVVNMIIWIWKEKYQAEMEYYDRADEVTNENEGDFFFEEFDKNGIYSSN